MIDRSELPEDMLIYDPPELDVAIIGIGRRCSCDDVLIYDREKLVQAFMDVNGWDHEGADEWVEFNVEGGWIGDTTPIIMERIEQ